MVITQVDAHVAEGRWKELREAYRSMAGEIDPRMVRTYLLQDTEDRTLWRVATVWKSMEALQEYRRSVEVPGAFLLFQNVGAEPSRTIFEVAEYAPRG
jgi:heme-degrading monooxygenase HmoA